MISLRSGGWVILAALVVFVVAAGWQIEAVRRSHRSRSIGDGRNVESYGFDLSTCLVPRELLAASGLPRDALPRLDYPRIATAPAIKKESGRSHEGKYLVPSDRVIGVEIGGIARAYPIRVLAWHEVVNDTLAGKPIAVTYSPLCDASVVFDRSPAGEVLDFGHSGLFFNQNLVLYDRRPESDRSSLWSQLQARAIAGPAAGATLTVVPFIVSHWSEWTARHPNTTVLEPDAAMRRQYDREPYVSYFGNDLLRDYPVAPLPTENTVGGAMPKKTSVLAIQLASVRCVVPLPVIAAHADAEGFWGVVLDGRRVRLRYAGDPPVAWMEAPDAVAIPAFWFAWHAMFPGDPLAGADFAL